VLVDGFLLVMRRATVKVEVESGIHQ